MLIVGGDGGVDVRIAGGRILDVGPGLDRRGEDDVVDAGGGAIVPGLHDHHVHLRATAAAAASVPVGQLQEAAVNTPPGQWLRAVGYHESIAGPLDRWRLDELVPDRPVRVQHRSGGLWVLNSLALDLAGAATADEPGIERDEHGTPTGRLWRLDGWLAGVVPPTPLDLAAVSRQAASQGIVGFTDADPHRTQADVDLLATAEMAQHVTLMSSAGLDLPDAFTPGPRKLLLDDD
ncbi:MAG TPA: amidohydrolase family protein, partial [Acidimicrobiales bacterium]|nr:amidohydrolase family protein [Acidimicrobiales bacterium]